MYSITAIVTVTGKVINNYPNYVLMICQSVVMNPETLFLCTTPKPSLATYCMAYTLQTGHLSV